MLAIESATIGLGVAICDGEQLIAIDQRRANRNHAEEMIVMITALLAAAKLELSAIDAIAVDIGPGRFTGIRVGIATAKSLAFALGIPAVGVASTEILLASVPKGDRPVVAVVDLRRGDLAVCFGSDGHVAAPVRTVPDRLSSELHRRFATTGALLIGDGASVHRTVLEDRSIGIEVAHDAYDVPDPSALCRTGIVRLGAGSDGDPFLLDALYLKEADVNIGWATRDAPAHTAMS